LTSPSSDFVRARPGSLQEAYGFSLFGRVRGRIHAAIVPGNQAEMTYPQLVLITVVRFDGSPAGHNAFAASPKE
jgi:hypothetical protein